MKIKGKYFFSGKHWKIVLLIILSGGTVYLNSLQNGFIWDDEELIVNNEFIKNPQNIYTILSPKYFTQVVPGIRNVARPVWVLSAIFDYRFWGLNPFGHHLTNLVLHLLNSVLVYFFVYLLSRDLVIGAVSGLIFALHPIHTESVSVIGFRADVLMLVFCMFGFILFIKSTTAGKIGQKILYFFGINLSFILAVLSKDMAVTLPLLFILYDFYFISEGSLRKLCRRLPWYLPYLFLIIAYLVYRGPRFSYEIPLNQNIAGRLPGVYTDIWTNLFTMSKVFAHYLKLLFLPINLCADYSFPAFSSIKEPAVIFSLLTILFFIFLGLHTYRREKIFSFAIFWFFISLIPVSNVIPIFNVAAERYLYFPSVGFSLLLTIILIKMSERLGSRSGLFLRTIIIALLLFYSVLTIRRNFDWKDEISIWSKTLRASPQSARVHANLGVAYQRKNMDEAAIKEYQTALLLNAREYGYKILEDRIYNYLGKIYYKNMNYDRAIDYFKMSLVIKADFAEVYYNLGLAYQKKGQDDEAIVNYQQAVKFAPDYVEAYNNLGSVYAKNGRYEEAAVHLEKAVRINSRHLNAYKNLGKVYLCQRRYAQAVEIFKKAKEISPGDAEAEGNYRLALELLGF